MWSSSSPRSATRRSSTTRSVRTTRRYCARGVKIYLYKAPYILHSKHFTIDEDVAVIGSSNMDIRSFELNMEISLLVRGGASFVREMREVEAGYRENSRTLTLEEWMQQPLLSTVLDNLARLTSALQ